ncbi:hypothetical protein Asppvi_007087 [Aspergillus pseudoviridinutans]|uniref:Major facilitator superfamily (MFS) profile domain-containing protein n=1 Tax=Aspergillus pseudoviridinutans TaxID=1517512 RepID=A0A9P3BHY8_9EURO|nr:uncharacterized protein Asppvi_007087 [Aspergillus pseudoviridinutans]GIJ88169.1 hypothetical protein Asppvi_007087 [Aspergillus pseudoviridinutans]
MTEKATALVQSIRGSQRSLEFTNDEHLETFWVAVRRHWPAVTWGLLMNLRTYGYQHEGTHIIAAPWLSALNYATLLGAIIGALLSGLAYDRFGPRVMITICSGLSTGFIFVQYFSHTPAQLFVGELVNGCIIAFYPMCASAYVGEVTTLVLRGFIATMTNLTFSIGSLIASGILKGTAAMDTTWSYKIPIAAQWALPTQGRDDAATVSLRRLTTAPGAEVYVARKLAHIWETLRLEELPGRLSDVSGVLPRTESPPAGDLRDGVQYAGVHRERFFHQLRRAFHGDGGAGRLACVLDEHWSDGDRAGRDVPLVVSGVVHRPSDNVFVQLCDVDDHAARDRGDRSCSAPDEYDLGAMRTYARLQFRLRSDACSVLLRAAGGSLC